MVAAQKPHPETLPKLFVERTDDRDTDQQRYELPRCTQKIRGMPQPVGELIVVANAVQGAVRGHRYDDRSCNDQRVDGSGDHRRYRCAVRDHQQQLAPRGMSRRPETLARTRYERQDRQTWPARRTAASMFACVLPLIPRTWIMLTVAANAINRPDKNCTTPHTTAVAWRTLRVVFVALVRRRHSSQFRKSTAPIRRQKPAPTHASVAARSASKPRGRARGRTIATSPIDIALRAPTKAHRSPENAVNAGKASAPNSQPATKRAAPIPETTRLAPPDPGVLPAWLVKPPITMKRPTLPAQNPAINRTQRQKSRTPLRSRHCP